MSVCASDSVVLCCLDAKPSSILLVLGAWAECIDCYSTVHFVGGRIYASNDLLLSSIAQYGGMYNAVLETCKLSFQLALLFSHSSYFKLCVFNIDIKFKWLVYSKITL